jgi:hypothetical protein
VLRRVYAEDAALVAWPVTQVVEFAGRNAPMRVGQGTVL